MELRHLRYFVTLAEELHFTRAAARLRIRQPPLSMQIKQLEEEIGVPLFLRLSRGVELTIAGAAFLADAKAILAQLDRAVTTAESLARGQTGRLRVGFGGATYMPAAIPSAILRFRAQFPGVDLVPEQSNTPALVAGLEEGLLDIAFIRPPFDMTETLTTEPFLVEAMLAVLSARHPLANQGPLALEALAREVFILFPRDIGPGLYDSIIAACTRAGFAPRLGQAASQIVAAIPMVAAGFGVSLVPRSLSVLGIPEIAFCELADASLTAPISLAWRASDRSPVLANFLDTMRERGPGKPETLRRPRGRARGTGKG